MQENRYKKTCYNTKKLMPGLYNVKVDNSDCREVAYLQQKNIYKNIKFLRDLTFSSRGFLSF